MNIIWATRGRTWGFRFLRTANVPDPLKVYEAAFAGAEETPTVLHAADGMVAVRFPDPVGRKDRAGRVIPHEFVVLPPDSENITSPETAQSLLWPHVADTFSKVWDQPTPPVSTA